MRIVTMVLMRSFVLQVPPNIIPAMLNISVVPETTFVCQIFTGVMGTVIVKMERMKCNVLMLLYRITVRVLSLTINVLMLKKLVSLPGIIVMENLTVWTAVMNLIVAIKLIIWIALLRANMPAMMNLEMLR